MRTHAIQDNSAFDTNSGPLSLGRKVGAPRSLTRRESLYTRAADRRRLAIEAMHKLTNEK